MTTHPTADLDRLSFHEGVLLLAVLLMVIAGVGFAWICAWERWGGAFRSRREEEDEEIERLMRWIGADEPEQHRSLLSETSRERSQS